MEKLNKVTTNGTTYTLQDYELNNSLSGINGLVKSSIGYLTEAIAGIDYDYPVLVGTSAPTPNTKGEIGQRYINKNATMQNGLAAEYVCTSVGSVYTWIPIGTIGNVLTIIADTYSPSSTYEIGDIVVYENYLYKCSVKIAKGEEWISSHWVSITIESLINEQVAILNVLINDKAPSVHTHVINGTREINVDNWTLAANDDGYYYNTVTVDSISASDNPIVDIVLTSNKQENEDYLRAWGCIDRIETQTKTIILYAKERPTNNFTMQFKVIR